MTLVILIVLVIWAMVRWGLWLNERKRHAAHLSRKRDAFAQVYGMGPS